MNDLAVRFPVCECLYITIPTILSLHGNLRSDHVPLQLSRDVPSNVV